ncbi:DUF1819 family protein [Tsukamurella spumae]|uniref:DUF1819 family protein n=1 Tax=Tsukamurella spumae TaxID=44753 RepID=A0A846WXD8_9ACTN|nr:DUF1819 family protein [Tsukamurella spumae]NKY16935.1 DUF1819 family protein [Tsukamurella spumae]
MAGEPYRLSFTTGGLLVNESAAVAGLLLSEGDASRAWSVAVERNVVQQRIRSSTVRVTSEAVRRLAAVPRAGLRIIADGPGVQSRILLWVAACARYRLLRDFGREVLRDRLLAERPLVEPDDFETFWNVQSAWVDALRDAAPSTRVKLRQTTFRMARDAGFLDEAGRVLAAALTSDTAQVISELDASLVMSLPLHHGQLAGIGAEVEGRHD